MLNIILLSNSDVDIIANIKGEFFNIDFYEVLEGITVF